MKLVFCTYNAHKVREVSEIMGPQFQFLTLKDIQFDKEIPEPYNTLEENAKEKATRVYQYCGLPCFAEDTGLFIDALQGDPGVRSARYAGEPVNSARNVALVMKKLKGEKNRNAFFRTVIHYLSPQQSLSFDGICRGKIATEISGNEGFGYDPIFVPDDFQQTFADMNASEKNQISHRKKAFGKFELYLKSQLQQHAGEN